MLRSSRKQLGCSPITQLPTELLARIFQDLAHEYYPSAKWVVVSEVCRAWYIVVLDTPTLWSRITVRSGDTPERIKLWLTRSRKAPLVVDALWKLALPATTWSTAEVYNTILPELGRVRVLQIQLPRSLCKDLQWPAERTTETREVALLGTATTILLQKYETDNITLIAGGFAEQFPKLERLLVQFFLFRFSEWNLPSSLTYLTVDNASNVMPGYQYSYDMRKVLSVLQDLPLLVSLTLRKTLPVCATGSQLPIVHLSHLLHLNVFEHALPSAQLLGHLACTPEAELQLEFEVDTLCSQIPTIHNAVMTHVNAHAKPFRNVVLAASGGLRICRMQRFSLAAWPGCSEEITWEDAALGHLGLAFTLEEIIDPHLLNDVWVWDFPQLETIYADLPLWQVEELFVDFHEGRYIDMPKVYECMKNVAILRVRGHVYRPSCAKFTRLLEDGRKGEPIFPGMHSMEIIGINFADSWRSEDSQHGTMHRLLELLQYRRQRGLGPTRLTLHKCSGLTNKDIVALEVFVPVSWDEWADPDPWTPRT